MSLSSALSTAKSSLAATQAQTALVSRNIANANVEGATRKYANVVTAADGRVEVRSLAQSQNAGLYRNMLDATSALNQTDAVKQGLTRIDETIGDIENGRTPSALIGTLSDKLKAYAANPTSADFARTAVDAAKDLVTALNEGSAAVDGIRRNADDDLADAAAKMNGILSDIEKLNKDIVGGTARQEDITDLVDQRDRKIAELSQYVGVAVRERAGGDIVLYTDSGVTLFDKFASKVTFETTHPLVAGQSGNGLRIDGTLVTGDTAVMPIRTGKVAGLITLRDEVATTYQSQLDEIAKSLVQAFQEAKTDGTNPVQGLFQGRTDGVASTARLGRFAPDGLAAGDVLSFDVSLNGVTYKAKGTVSATDIQSPAAYADFLKSALPASVRSQITVYASSTVVTFSAATSNGLGLQVSNLATNVASKDGGLAVNATPATSLAVGSFDAGTIASGDTLAFTFKYGTTTYSATAAFAGVQTEASFRAGLANAIAAAKPVGGGAALGTGKIAIGGASPALTFDAAPIPPAATPTLTLETLTATAADPAAHAGGFAAGRSIDTYPGLAGVLTLADGVVANPIKLRDGLGVTYNATGAAGFTGRINDLVSSLGAARAFGGAAVGVTGGTLLDFANASVSWLQDKRSEATSTSAYKQTLLDRTKETLSNETGVNINEESLRLLDLERSYQASAKILSTVDEMIKALLNSI